MKVISTTDLSHEGNDCYIYEIVSLIKSGDLYVVLGIKQTIGWYENNEVYTEGITDDFERAKFLYRFAGGLIYA